MFNNLSDGTTIVATLVAFVLAITIHEFSHAWTATMLGDQTAARQGRVTLNPLAHLDPLGSIGLLLVIFGGFGIGWGRPVPVVTSNLKWRGRGMTLVSLAGPLSNVLLAALFVIPLRAGSVAGGATAETFLRQIVLVNILLASFNFIPVPPLDGFNMLSGLLPRFWDPLLAPLARYGVLILLALIMFGGIGASLLQPMYAPIYNGLSSLILR